MMKLFLSLIILLALVSSTIAFKSQYNYRKVAIYQKNETVDSLAAIQLGRHLFYDPILSRDSSISCSTCHQQHLAFTDGLKKSIGIKGQRVSRNSPTLVNFKNQTSFLLDGVNPSLQAQTLVPIQEHKEFDFHILLLVERLKNSNFYNQLSKKAYGIEPNEYVYAHSIASFEKTLISKNAPFDQFQKGVQNALNESEKNGLEIFTQKLYCTKCHSGNNFTNYSLTNNGLYKVYADSGRMRLTELEKDRAIFKTPSLRNIGITAPYMHDGSIATLREVIEHYASGGKNHKHQSDFIQPFTLTPKEKLDLINFLHSLTDQKFITNPNFSNPF